MSKSRKIYDISATIGKYKDKTTGDERNRYLTCGAVFEGEDGRLFMKLDALPTSPEWSGYFQFYTPNYQGPEQGQPPARPQIQGGLGHTTPPPPAQRSTQQTADDYNEDDSSDLPF